MKVVHWKDCEDKKIDTFPYKGKKNEVVGTSIRWLSETGDDGHGFPEYGLRFFTIQPGGHIPIHNHFYHQTMYILTHEPSEFGLPESPQLATNNAWAQWLSGAIAAGLVAAIPFWFVFKRKKDYGKNYSW